MINQEFIKAHRYHRSRRRWRRRQAWGEVPSDPLSRGQAARLKVEYLPLLLEPEEEQLPLLLLQPERETPRRWGRRPKLCRRPSERELVAEAVKQHSRRHRRKTSFAGWKRPLRGWPLTRRRMEPRRSVRTAKTLHDVDSPSTSRRRRSPPRSKRASRRTRTMFSRVS